MQIQHINQPLEKQNLSETFNDIDTTIMQNSVTSDLFDQIKITQTQRDEQLRSQNNKLTQFPQLDCNLFDLYREYRVNITNVINTKSVVQRQLDYPDITFSDYRRILTIWQKIDVKTAQEFVGIDQFLKIGDLSRLAMGKWLNDTIIASYCQILSKYIASRIHQKDSYNQKYAIYDSMKTSSIFMKSDPEDITKMLQKNINWSPANALIFVLNSRKHWFFVEVPPILQQSIQICLTIYDSSIHSKNFYSEVKSFTKIMNYFSKHGKIIKFSCAQNFSQQQNNSDCGIMTLCGIKDVIRGYLSWSFSASDMSFKRAKITKQLVLGKIDVM